jgi:hypothetical protein
MNLQHGVQELVRDVQHKLCSHVTNLNDDILRKGKSTCAPWASLSDYKVQYDRKLGLKFSASK